MMGKSSKQKSTAIADFLKDLAIERGWALHDGGIILVRDDPHRPTISRSEMAMDSSNHSRQSSSCYSSSFSSLSPTLSQNGGPATSSRWDPEWTRQRLEMNRSPSLPTPRVASCGRRSCLKSVSTISSSSDEVVLATEQTMVVAQGQAQSKSLSPRDHPDDCEEGETYISTMIEHKEDAGNFSTCSSGMPRLENFPPSPMDESPDSVVTDLRKASPTMTTSTTTITPSSPMTTTGKTLSPPQSSSSGRCHIPSWKKSNQTCTRWLTSPKKKKQVRPPKVATLAPPVRQESHSNSSNDTTMIVVMNSTRPPKAATLAPPVRQESDPSSRNERMVQQQQQ
jgi:hypothetical protein